MHRPARRLAVVTAVAVFAVSAWFSVTWSRASLEPGSFAGPVSGLTRAAAGNGWDVQAGATEHVFAQTVRNGSRVSVTLTGITRHPGDPYLIEATYVPSDPRSGGVSPRSVGRPFPARLEPGAELYILVKSQQRQCLPMAAGSASVFESVEVQYRLYGVGRTADIQFPAPITHRAEDMLRSGRCLQS